MFQHFNRTLRNRQSLHGHESGLSDDYTGYVRGLGAFQSGDMEDLSKDIKRPSKRTRGRVALYYFLALLGAFSTLQ
jgi:hypothetical protein